MFELNAILFFQLKKEIHNTQTNFFIFIKEIYKSLMDFDKRIMDFLNGQKNSKNIIALKASISYEFKENINRI